MSVQIKARSEDFVMKRLDEEVSTLGALVRKLCDDQNNKADINRHMVRGIKKHGRSYADKLDGKKEKINNLISAQQLKIKDITKNLKKVKHLLSLVIHMEQASLAIHTSKEQDDLSKMIDVHRMPVAKFNQEMEHVKMLSSSFDMMNIELAKQQEYISSFNLKEHSMDEHYFYESEKLEGKLSEQEVVNVIQLRNFCDDLHMMIKRKLKNKMPFLTESDKAALEMMRELKKIKLTRGFFSLSIHSFINKVCRQNIHGAHNRHLISFLINFLLSRLKKYKPHTYYSQIRTTILCYNLCHEMDIIGLQRNDIVGAMLLSRLSQLDLKEDERKSDELRILTRYYHSVNRLFVEEFVIVSNIISHFRKTESEEPLLPWAAQGIRLMNIIDVFDSTLYKLGYDKVQISQNKELIKTQVMEKFKDSRREIEYLLSVWDHLIPKPLTIY